VHWRFAHWAYVDVWVTFAHARVVVPPPGVTAAAHRHGALSLGTLLFEGAPGAADLRTALRGPPALRAAVAAAAGALAAARGFDGWLLNAEVACLTDREVAALDAWVPAIAAAVRAAVGAAGTTVWYDAVTSDGRLGWQNGLSAANGRFFDGAPGGLLTNYHWGACMPVAAAVAAAAVGRPPADVYMGVDVHGRGSYGGGGFATPVALAAAAAAGTSAAVFAPAWAVEGPGGPGVPHPRTADVVAAQAVADARHERLWTGPPGGGGGRGGGGGGAAAGPPRPGPVGLPFATDWNPGWGVGPPSVRGGRPPAGGTAGGGGGGGDGDGGGDRRWFCMACQSVQASFRRTVHAGGVAAPPRAAGGHSACAPPMRGVVLGMDAEVAWTGGGCVRVAFPRRPPPPAAAAAAAAASTASGGQSPAADDARGPFALLRLLVARAPLPTDGTAVTVTYRLRGRPGATERAGLALRFTRPRGLLLLVGRDSAWSAAPAAALARVCLYASAGPVGVVAPTAVTGGGGAHAAAGGAAWTHRAYELPAAATAGRTLVEVLVLVGDPPAAAAAAAAAGAPAADGRGGRGLPAARVGASTPTATPAATPTRRPRRGRGPFSTTVPTPTPGAWCLDGATLVAFGNAVADAIGHARCARGQRGDALPSRAGGVEVQHPWCASGPRAGADATDGATAGASDEAREGATGASTDGATGASTDGPSAEPTAAPLPPPLPPDDPPAESEPPDADVVHIGSLSVAAAPQP